MDVLLSALVILHSFAVKIFLHQHSRHGGNGAEMIS